MPQEKHKVFVACPIGSDDSEERRRSDQLLEHIISPVAEDLNCQVTRADNIAMPGKITHQIDIELRSSDVVIVDLTDLNPNVMYELGVRQGLGRPYILMAAEGQKLPFDLRDYRTIFYKVCFVGVAGADARKSLKSQLESALSGQPSISDSSIFYDILEAKDYYKKLELITNNAKKSIDLMSMQREPPGMSGVDEVESYFGSIDDRIQKTNIRVRRLVSIQTEEKLTWVYDTIRKHKDCANFNLRYVDVDLLYNKGVFKKAREGGTELLPYPVNIQIIDKEHLFFINPELGYFRPCDDSKNIYINSKDIGDVFASYYRRYWQMSQTLVSCGKITEKSIMFLDNLLNQLKIDKK